jgi:uncharacterized protein (TIGR02217 family)
MASFHEVQFPPSISEGAVGGPRFSTSITALSSGAEHRNVNWVSSRGEWDVSHGLKTQQQVDALLTFFYARQGKAYGFRFKDWSDYRLPAWINTPGDLDAIPLLFTTDGVTTTFQLQKVYGDAGATYIRNIAKPVAGSLILLNNGSPTFDFSVSTTTGIVTLGSTTATSTGHLITGYCEFDVPVRFDTDDAKVTVITIDNFGWTPIPIVEIREIA